MINTSEAPIMVAIRLTDAFFVGKGAAKRARFVCDL